MEKIVLIPAYKPDERIIYFIDSLINLNMTVIVVDDGSGVEFNNIFNQLNPAIHCLAYQTNHGKGYALKVGYEYIKNNFNNYVIITADADGQHSINDIERIANIYPNNPGTLLLGVRNFDTDNIPKKSKVGNVITRNAISMLIKQNLTDTQTGLRAFDDSLIDLMIGIAGDRYEYETNVLFECSKRQIKIIEEKIMTIYENNNEGSHFNPVKDSIVISKQIMKFASSSFISFLIDYSLYVILLQLTGSWELALSISFANIIARIISASINFYINNRIIFKSDQNILKSAITYFFLALLILGGNTIFLNILIDLLGMNVYLAKIISEISFFILSYLVQKNVIFKNKKVKVHYEKNYLNC